MVSQFAVLGFSADVPKPVSCSLVIMAATILADGPRHSGGSQTFLSEARRSVVLKNFGVKLSEARLLLWYELHRDIILEKMKPAEFKDWFYGLLASLESLTEKIHILNMMQRIAESGKPVNVNGLALFALTKRYWQG